MSITASNPATQTSLTHTVPCEYVHKSAQSEVLLTGWSPAGPDRHRITARWPLAHPFYAPAGGFHDPMLVAESVRQCVPLLSHVAYDVPFGHRQVWSRFRYEIDPAALATSDAPAEVEMRVTCPKVTRRAGRLVSVDMHVDLSLDNRPLGTAFTRFADLSPAVYPRLRGPYADIDEAYRRTIPLAPPTAPASVTRTGFTDVVLSPTNSPTLHQLRVDLTHPALFDHPVDHVPGMLLLEAARQATHAQTHPQPVIATAMEAEFAQYVELDAPCWIHVGPPGEESGRDGDGPGAAPVRVMAVQNEACAFTATVTPTAVSGA
ncbi:ScbA/BarX family gamma-butyrolactone biosynthesis protein [Streptomyces sp. MA5143a]|uniref:ScbA/BarX family gamma-butyrolactone biosynthesis protein n=1 Tax=Streptomyces sp. MA5143a TaxID=2083010 RepID=UPI000D1BD4AC|nr:ScbA/BarX family gamma-butyrolactone biosynthesis protein [Streptomyces sp. MA5143a]SPF07281.1 A-factor biosynthesis hotdog domain protein [Streptomyces sp. MA5143a]